MVGIDTARHWVYHVLPCPVLSWIPRVYDELFVGEISITNLLTIYFLRLDHLRYYNHGRDIAIQGGTIALCEDGKSRKG